MFLDQTKLCHTVYYALYIVYIKVMRQTFYNSRGMHKGVDVQSMNSYTTQRGQIFFSLSFVTQNQTIALALPHIPTRRDLLCTPLAL